MHARIGDVVEEDDDDDGKGKERGCRGKKVGEMLSSDWLDWNGMDKEGDKTHSSSKENQKIESERKRRSSHSLMITRSSSYNIISTRAPLPGTMKEASFTKKQYCILILDE